MKNIFSALIIALSAMIVSCGPNQEQQKKEAMEDSIKRIDSITNIFIGTWKKDNNYSVRISKIGKLFTVHYGRNSESEATGAYTLDGQILKPVDNNDSPFSLIEDGKLLFKGSIYTKGNNSNSNATSGIKANQQTKITSASTTKSPSNSNAITTSTTTSPSSSVSDTKELSIITQNVINLHQRPANNSLVIQGLSNGEVCKIIKKGKQETIAGKTDYWYEVSADGESGWVFGAFTSLRQQ